MLKLFFRRLQNQIDHLKKSPLGTVLIDCSYNRGHKWTLYIHHEPARQKEAFIT